MAYSKEQLRSIFQNKFDREAWKAIVINIFGANKVRRENEQLTDSDESETGYYMGSITTPDRFQIGLFYYKINSGSVAHKKVGLRNLVKSFINPAWGKFDAAIVVFNDEQEWRLSFVCDIKEEATAPKRFTFVFGEKDNFYRTAIERFIHLQSQEQPTFENIRKAFSVDALSDDFFDTYRELYADFVQYITGKRYVKESNKWVERAIDEPDYQYETTFGHDDKLVRDYIKKMFGRIVFLYFLQRKGWLGGNRQYMHDLFYHSDNKDNFLDGVLEPLFFEVLNTDKPYRTDAARTLPESENIPYLNGGLFAQDDIDALDCVFPENLFKKLFDFLDSYNFTIDENDTDDAEIGIDPEMLGRIFENLLEDNKDKGAFYTPKEIVRYMCRESLIEYLKVHKGDIVSDDEIRLLVEKFDGENLSLDQRKHIKDKLKEIKICDPAIGSGAFPMGLVNLLSKIYQVLKLSTDMSTIKRHIMEQNIYGVDIEQGAVDIARLRFWLAMIVEEKEPIPLPNLHFKIMQGNSLLESYKGIDLSDLTKVSSKLKEGEGRGFWDTEDSEREALISALKSYYKTSDHTQRERLFNDIINNVRRQLYDKGIVLPQGEDPSANTDFFLWHTWFSDVFENGGFDIVIGNPPYIQLQNNGGELAELYEHCGYKTFARTGDIYCLFYERGWQLLKKYGHLCYITSNKWMRAGYGASLRGFFSKNTNPFLLIDFAGVKIFESATVDTNILLLSKSGNKHKTICAVTNKQNKDSVKNLSDFVQRHNSICDFSTYNSWVILSPIEQSIKRKIEAVGTPLKDWDINIYRGVLTGCNDAFIIDTEKRNEILANCQDEEERKKTAELIRPILRGRDIKRYSYDWAGLWIINTHNGIKGKLPRIDVNEYPAIKAHLDQYWDKICKRADKGDTPYNLRNCAYMEDFDKPKIVFQELTQGSSFAIDLNGEFFVSNTAYLITGEHLSFLLQMLNSKFIEWSYRTFYGTLIGENGLRWLSQDILTLPIPIYQDAWLYNYIANSGDIDGIYRLFYLNNEEIKFIKSQYIQ